MGSTAHTYAYARDINPLHLEQNLYMPGYIRGVSPLFQMSLILDSPL